MSHGKKYVAASEKIDQDKTYSLSEAAALVKEIATRGFDETVEMHVNCNLDVRHADQTVRQSLVLPAGSGKDVKVAVFAQEDAEQKAATDAGADFAGGEELVDKVLKENWTDFDVAIATPAMMKVLAKAGKILGTKGLMPNPKAGTVTPNVAGAVKESKAGKMEFRTDAYGLIHMSLGKTSFSLEDLEKNLEAAAEAVLEAKPSGCKGNYIKAAYVTTTMGPSIRVSL